MSSISQHFQRTSAPDNKRQRPGESKPFCRVCQGTVFELRTAQSGKQFYSCANNFCKKGHFHWAELEEKGPMAPKEPNCKACGHVLKSGRARDGRLYYACPFGKREGCNDGTFIWDEEVEPVPQERRSPSPNGGEAMLALQKDMVELKTHVDELRMALGKVVVELQSLAEAKSKI